MYAGTHQNDFTEVIWFSQVTLFTALTGVFHGDTWQVRRGKPEDGEALAYWQEW